MRRTALLLVGLLSVMVQATESPKEYNDKTEIADIEGTWQLIECECNGAKVEMSGEVMTFRSGTYTYLYSDGEMRRGNYCIDTTRKPPHLDLLPSKGPYKGQTLTNIYQVDGDKLEWAQALDERDPRPEKFTDRNVEIYRYKRVK
jgi:uncharacterized protein (TIGR03067 family)